MTHDAGKICPRILIVDDNQDHCELIRDALATYYRLGPDSRLMIVRGGRQCLEQDFQDYDIVLLDLHLPDMPGLTVLEEILRRTDIPVIFVTGENDLSIASQAIEAGAQDYIVKHGDYLFAIPPLVEKNLRLHSIKIEHDRLQLRLEWMLEELQAKNRQLEESMAKLRELATTDPLTGLDNRRFFAEHLAREFSQAQRHDNELSCCMIDLDHYKEFNDTLGHQMGDELLQRTADIIRLSLREGDVAARYGGDEFVLLLPMTTSEEALRVVQRIREEMSVEFRRNAHLRIPVTLSVGVASSRDDFPSSADALVAMADRALYHAKATGKDRITLFREFRQEVEAANPYSDSR
ncbi:MAG: diguanylate cyclase [Phycisphaerae bacterium]|nr:diguanylate cyclase [Phycisphaerae bacterium]